MKVLLCLEELAAFVGAAAAEGFGAVVKGFVEVPEQDGFWFVAWKYCSDFVGE